MSQKIKEIKIADLVLWTENPRDPIDPKSSDQDIANLAWEDQKEKWNLESLAKDMKTHYDMSELPTVVYHGDTPIVYDGNRRMILAKIKHGCVKLDGFDLDKLPKIPKNIPCNVCSENIAIQNVYRKHGDSGSWSPLERDLFVHKFMNQPKSPFLKLDEGTGLISANPHLNKVFVKNEIFTIDKLKELGFGFKNGNILSRHTQSESSAILNDISYKVANKTISTRHNRGKVREVLEKQNRTILETNSKNKLSEFNILAATNPTVPSQKKKSPRTKSKTPQIFNGDLYLEAGQVSDLYRDIVDLYKHYQQNKSTFSQYFPSLVRMSLRLLCEAASSDSNLSLDKYISTNFKVAKKKFDADTKTTLSSLNVKETTIVQLLHIGAHNYKAANNIDQTIAISIVLGEILNITHGKQ